MAEEWESRVEEEQKRLLKNESWYHSCLPRPLLPLVLLKDGDFLLRFNVKKGGHDFVISVLWAGKPEHFKINVCNAGKVFYIRHDASFAGIRELVSHHLATGEPLSKRSGIRIKTPAPRDRWEGRRRDVCLEHKVGTWSYGEVWRGSYNRRYNRGDQYAARGEYGRREIVAKTFKDRKLTKGVPDGRAEYELEAMHLFYISSSHMIQTVGIILSGDPLMILTEHMSKGELSFYLRINKESIDSDRQREICQEVCSALVYLAGHGYVYYDVATHNCHVTEHDCVKIRPPSVKGGQDKLKILLRKAAIRWMAPEAMRKGVFTSASDVWSFGVLIWEVLSYGAQPWSGLGRDEVRQRILVDNARLPTPPNSDTALATQMESCWKTEPESRPTFHQLSAALDSRPLDTA